MEDVKRGPRARKSSVLDENAVDSLLGELSFGTGAAVHTQITAFVRTLIQKGALAPETRVPSVQHLASLWSTNPYTVHIALRLLAEDGYLVRRPRLGTFVRGRNTKNLRVGIYYGTDFWRSEEREYFAVIQSHLESLLAERKWGFDLWIDSRPAKDKSKCLPELQQAVSRRQISGLIVPDMKRQELAWLRNLHLPMTGVSAVKEFRPGIYPNVLQMFEGMMKYFHQGKCRSVGMIVPLDGPWDATPLSAEHKDFFDAFETARLSFAMQTRPEWIISGVKAGKSNKHFGYEGFHQLWKQKSRPESLIIFPDTTSEGAVTAIMELGVRVPRDLRLGLQRNEGVDLLCPLPACWAVMETRQVSALLIQQLADKIALREPLPGLLDYRMEIPEVSRSKSFSKP